MKSFDIVEVDKDYNTVSRIFTMQFADLKEADEWCRNESWTGYFYFVMKP